MQEIAFKQFRPRTAFVFISQQQVRLGTSVRLCRIEKVVKGREGKGRQPEDLGRTNGEKPVHPIWLCI